MKIRKAVITSAGFGTRFLPVTKTIQKEMLPILNRPMIDYVVQDCVAAGIEEIIFVVKENETRLVQHFYSDSRSLRQHLQKTGKMDAYKDHLQAIESVKFRFVTQTIADEYGTAVPVKLSKKYLKDEDAFLVFMGDDFIFNPDNTETAAMIQLFESSGADALVTCIEKPENELHRYGVAETREEQGNVYLTNLVEKPEKGTAPSNLINISKYIFTPKIFEILKDQEVDAKSGELYITDTATTFAQNNDVVIYTPQGRYLDGGSVLNWLQANIVLANANEHLRDNLRTFIKSEFDL